MGKEDLLSKPENIRGNIVEGRINKLVSQKALLEQAWILDTDKTVKQAVQEVVAKLGENIKIRRFEKYNLGEGIEVEKKDFADEVAEQTQKKEPKAEKVQEPEAEAPPAEEEKPKVAISAKMVKELRESTGAGMMDCKKALSECGGDVAEAEEYLRKKGIASAEKRASRTAAEGVISSYIHAGSRIGVLLEMNCETDFVARNPEYAELVNTVAMQIAASDVLYVDAADADPEWVAKEREIEMGKEDLLSKPENIRGNINKGPPMKTSR